MELAAGEALALTEKDKETEPSPPPAEKDWSQVPFWTSKRFLTAVVTFWGFACLYFQRINLSIAMVCMVKVEKKNLTEIIAESDSVRINYSSHADGNATLGSGGVGVMDLVTAATDMTTKLMKTVLEPGDEGYCESLGLKTLDDSTGEFTWSKSLQGLILSSFFWGYLVLQVPGGMLSEKYGPRRVVFYTMLPVAILGLVSPVSARISPWLFLFVRVIIGVGESALYPAAQALFARWSPPSERSRLVGVSLSGGQFGNALIFPIGGLLCSAVSWDSVFYVMGGIGFLWCIIWFVVVSDSPAMSKRISPLEREYIEHHVTYRDGKKQQPKPWRAIFTSLPFWAILMGHTCGNYGLYMLLTQIPTYMKEVLKFDLKSNGAFSMLPYLSMWLFITIAGIVSDLLMSKNILSRVVTRKLMSSIGLFGPAISCVAISFLDCTQQTLAVFLLCGCVGLSGVAFAGYMVNHGDIAPQFAGTLFGITNTAATIPGIVAPYVVGAITPNKSQEEWQVAFFIAAGILMFGGVFYLIFGKAQLEKWAELPPSWDNEAEIESKEMMKDGKATESNGI